MKKLSSGFANYSEKFINNLTSPLYITVFDALENFGVELHLSTKRTLADLTATMISTLSVNMSLLSRNCARRTGDKDSSIRAFSRFLENPNVQISRVMQQLLTPIFHSANMFGIELTIIMDQTKINDGRECLMIALKYHQRAIPVIWIVKTTKGELGFSTQRELLGMFEDIIFEFPNLKIFFVADRFYGHPKLIEYLNQRGWLYAIRLKDYLKVYYEGEEFKTKDILSRFPRGCHQVELTAKKVVTSIHAMQDKSQKEPWIIAVNDKPNIAKVRKYAYRWAIEPMFKDLKSSGFNIHKTKLQRIDRIERLILCAAIAMILCILFALKQQPDWQKYAAKKAARSRLSQFQQGLRLFIEYWNHQKEFPKYWENINLILIYDPIKTKRIGGLSPRLNK